MKNIPIGIVIKEDKVLLVLRRFPPLVWSPPGGFPDENEDYASAVVREVYEESGIHCDPVCKAAELHMEEYQSNLIIYACRYISGNLRCSYESKDVAWFDINSLPEPLSPSREIFLKSYNLLKNSST